MMVTASRPVSCRMVSVTAKTAKTATNRTGTFIYSGTNALRNAAAIPAPTAHPANAAKPMPEPIVQIAAPADSPVSRTSTTSSSNTAIRTPMGSFRMASHCRILAGRARSFAWLANTLHKFGTSMQPGDVILSGSFVRAVPFDANQSLVALFDGLGEVTLKVME